MSWSVKIAWWPESFFVDFLIIYIFSVSVATVSTVCFVHNLNNVSLSHVCAFLSSFIFHLPHLLSLFRTLNLLTLDATINQVLLSHERSRCHFFFFHYCWDNVYCRAWSWDTTFFMYNPIFNLTGPTAIKHLPTFCTLLHICFFALPPSVCTELRPSSLTSHSQSSASDLSLFRGHNSVLILFSCSATCHVVFTAALLLLTTAYLLL